MSLKDVRAAIDRFLLSKSSQAIAISGHWGTGKTYFWNDVIKEFASNGLTRKYSYVSLFGLNSLADLKSAIFDNALSAKDIGEGASSSTWLENARHLLQSSSSFDGAKDTSRKIINFGRRNLSQATPILGSWGSIARAISFLAVRDYLICLDDLERRGSGLSLKDVLGLISLLKEQHRCRVVVIMNEDEIGDEGDKETLKSLKEKVFDREIIFSTSVQERVDLVFTGEWEHSGSVADKVVQLAIKNIRIMQRIRWVVEALLPFVKGKDPALTKQLIHSSALLTWCYYGHGGDVPSYELIKSDGFMMWGMLDGDKKEKTREEQLVEKVQYGYGYNGTDALDKQICLFLEQGFVVESDFLEVVESFQEKAIRDRHDGSFSQAWGLFHDTFANNADQLVESLRARFLEGVSWISLGNAMGTVKLMRELGRNDVGDELMHCWIDMAKKENKDLLDLSRAHLLAESVDEMFKEAVKHAYANDKDLPTLSDTIVDIAGKNGWSQDQIEVLSQAAVEEYRQFFKSIDGDRRLSSYVRACLQFGGFAGDERYKRIFESASAALRNIAAESQVNAIRVARFLPDD